MTKKLLQLALMAAMTASLSMSVSSCKDNDNDDGRTAEEQAADPYEKETDAGHALFNLLSQLSAIGDELPDNWKEATFEAEAGMVTDASKPTVQSITVNSLQEAVTRYNSLTGQNISTSTEMDIWQMDDVGAMAFTALNRSDCFATIDVHVKQLPHLTELRFVPVSAIGDNGKFDGEPYYRFGDVVRDPNEDTYWICVRPAYSPNKKDVSHWMSFQLSQNNMLDPKKSGCLPQKVPTKLGKELEKMQYLAQLLTIFARPTEEITKDGFIKSFKTEYGNRPFGDGGVGLGGLLQAAMTNEEIIRAAKYWMELGVWDKVKPSDDISADAFRQSFQNAVNFLYNGYTTSGKNLILYRASYTDDFSFFKGEPQYNEIKLDMKTVSFDVEKKFSKTGRYGDESYKSVGNCYVVRYKTGKQLSTNKVFNPKPTEKLPGVEDVYRFNDPENPVVDGFISADEVKVGNIIGKDGRFYTDAKAAKARNIEPAALVVYMDKSNRVEALGSFNGLAIAVEDLKADGDTKFAFSNRKKNYGSSMAYVKDVYANMLDGIAMTEKLAKEGASYPAAAAVNKMEQLDSKETSFSSWFIPSVGQWILALKGMGYEWKNNAISGSSNAIWKNAGLTGSELTSNSVEGRYWTVSEAPNGNAVAMTYDMKYAFMTYDMTSKYRVRPMIAFGSDGKEDPDYVALPVAPKVGSLLCANGLCFDKDDARELYDTEYAPYPRALVVSVQEESGKIETGKDWKIMAISLYNASNSHDNYFWWFADKRDYDGPCATTDPTQLNGFAMTEKLASGCGNDHTHGAALAVNRYAEKFKVDGGHWFLPSAGQWTLALQGMGLTYNKETKRFTPAGKDGFKEVNAYFSELAKKEYADPLASEKTEGKYFHNNTVGYWTSTNMDKDNAYLIYLWDNEEGVKFDYAPDTYNLVRPFVAL